MVESARTMITRPALRAAAGIASFRDHARFAATLEAELGVPLPAGSGFVQAGGVTLSRLAPTRYFATGPREEALPARLATVLAGVAAVTEQSDLWEFFGVSGARVRDTLARLVPTDLDPARFRIGDLVLTRAGHLDVRLWRLGEASYEVAVARSYAADLQHLLVLDGSLS